jgi:alpha-glucosidase
MHGTLRFWLDRGVDGFRIDVVHGLVKASGLPDMPEGREWSQDRFDEPATHEVIRQMRRLVDAYPGDRMIVGEVYILSTAQVAAFYGAGDELHLAFNFPPLYAPWDAAAWQKRIDRVVEEFDPVGGWPTWVLSNHDNPRHRTRYGGSEARARAAAVLLLTLRGTPFLYAGEELGLEDAVVPPDREVDPGGRDGCRAPIPWTGTADHGWRGDPWLPWPPDAGGRHAEAQREDASSIFHLYRRLLAARHASPALRLGSYERLVAPAGAVVYRRSRDDDERVVIVNFTDAPVTVPVAGDRTVEVASDGNGEGVPYSGEVASSAAVLLR